jgi:hypothetical protein
MKKLKYSTGRDVVPPLKQVVKHIGCLFCDKPDNARRPRNAEYICSGCVQVFLRTEREEAQRVYLKVIELGMERKQKAIEMFFKDLEEEPDGERSGQNKHNKRKRPIRTLGY